MTIAAVGVFLPVYLLVVIPAPYFRRHRSQPTVKAFVDGVSAAATGAIGGAAHGEGEMTYEPTARAPRGQSRPAE